MVNLADSHQLISFASDYRFAARSPRPFPQAYQLTPNPRAHLPARARPSLGSPPVNEWRWREMTAEIPTVRVGLTVFPNFEICSMDRLPFNPRTYEIVEYHSS